MKLAALLMVAVTCGAQDETLAARWNRFAATAKVFASSYNAGKMDVGLAKKLNKQWADVQASGGWPR